MSMGERSDAGKWENPRKLWRTKIEKLEWWFWLYQKVVNCSVRGIFRAEGDWHQFLESSPPVVHFLLRSRPLLLVPLVVPLQNWLAVEDGNRLDRRPADEIKCERLELVAAICNPFESNPVEYYPLKELNVWPCNFDQPYA